MTRRLAPAESAVILDELAGATPGVAFASGPEAQPFALGQDDFRPTRLTGLERMGDKLARALKPALEPIARGRIGVSAQPLETISYGDWQDRLRGPVSLTLYRLRPLKGGMLVAIEPDFVARLVESFYGGAPGGSRQPKTGDFTPSEELLLRRLLDRLSTILVQHWNEVTPIDLALAGQEMSVLHLPFLRRDEGVVIQRFAIATDAGPSEIEVVYPLAMLRPIEEKMAARVHDEDVSTGTEWRRRMSDALQEVTLPVRSVLARPEISVAQLLSLKPGDVIPITLAPRTPLLAGSRRIADGVIGEQDGRAALMIEKVGQV
ncbi:FliM/FliN family flagellar motor switch protein [uncultured Sphingomonas sp.]|uniref:flagellar motor switch protein FliM n=1 Tax=uncultured Sphingomonas sp. TaxID=158754 RepID=UPI0025F414F5|nr:FliM/FliN family flagellar motor switch protein [uncultured Sphingomonas sp.]